MQHVQLPLRRPVSLVASVFGRDGASWRSALPLVLLAACVLVILLVTTSCGGFDATSECQTACDRYASCGNPDFDASLCTEECSDQAVGDAAFQTRVNTCDACVEDSDCVEGEEFGCVDECAGIIDD